MSTRAIIIDARRCKKCGFCAAYCKLSVLAFDGEHPPVAEDLSKCVGCRICENICPDFAIEVEVEK